MKEGHKLRNILVVVCIFALGFLPPAAQSSKERPAAKSEVPLSADEIAIYRSLLRHYVPQASASLNISSRTYPFDPSSPMNRMSENECLKGIKLENLNEVSHSFHELTLERSFGKEHAIGRSEKARHNRPKQ